MDLQFADKFIGLCRQGYTTTDLSKATSISSSTAARMLMFLKFHGEEAFKQHYVWNVRPKYDLRYEASIVEYVFENHVPLDKATVIFKLSSLSWLYKRLNKRRESGVPLYMDADSKIVEIPSNLENLNYRPMLTKAAAELAEAKAKGQEHTFLNASGRGSERDYDVSELEKGGVIIGTSKDAKPIKPEDVVSPVAKTIGRAKAPVRLIRPEKVMRRKDVAARKKDAQARDDANKPVEQPSVEPKDCIQGSTFRDPNPLHPATEYFDLLNKDGKVPINLIFDPNSEGFDKLPLEVQVRSYKRFCHDIQETNDCLKKFSAVILSNQGLE